MSWDPSAIAAIVVALIAAVTSVRTAQATSRAEAERERAKAALAAEDARRSVEAAAYTRARGFDDEVVARLNSDISRLAIQAREREAYAVAQHDADRLQIAALVERAEHAERRVEIAERRAVEAERRALVAERAVLNLTRRLDLLQIDGERSASSSDPRPEQDD